MTIQSEHAAWSDDAASVRTSRSPLSEAISQFGLAVSDYEKHLDRLRTRLRPLTSEEKPTASTEVTHNGGVPGSSPVVLMVCENTERLRNLNTGLSRLLDRLELGDDDQ